MHMRAAGPADNIDLVDQRVDQKQPHIGMGPGRRILDIDHFPHPRFRLAQPSVPHVHEQVPAIGAHRDHDRHVGHRAVAVFDRVNTGLGDGGPQIADPLPRDPQPGGHGGHGGHGHFLVAENTGNTQFHEPLFIRHRMRSPDSRVGSIGAARRRVQQLIHGWRAGAGSLGRVRGTGAMRQHPRYDSMIPRPCQAERGGAGVRFPGHFGYSSRGRPVARPRKEQPMPYLTHWLARLGLAGALLVVGLPGLTAAAQTAPPSHYFLETRHTVSGAFWDYWQHHGGLAQQGYPITEEFQEPSPVDGKPYTVQYFQRAVFELHPENAAPYTVLLTPLGRLAFHAQYPAAPAGQWVNSDRPQTFPQTGHTVGGGFRDYWQAHGGLAQFGYPLSDEFRETSPIDGRPYTVQYFERAVFEDHPEAPAGYHVLLCLLGTLRYHDRYESVAYPGLDRQPPAPGLAPATAPVLFNATFASADLSAWHGLEPADEAPTWRMLNARLQQEGGPGGENQPQTTVLLAGDPSWRDIQLEAQLYATSGDPAGIVWRAQGSRYYQLELLPALPNPHWKAALELVDGAHVTPLATVPPDRYAGYPFNGWVTIRVIAQGARQQVSIDGVALLDVQDSTLTQGQIGVYAAETGATAFDNIRVQQLGP